MGISKSYLFYHVLLETQTPVIVVKSSVKNWYTSYVDYIPSRTIVGSFVTALSMVDKGFGKRYREKPFLNASDFFLCSRIENGSCVPCLPAPPFSIQCKGSKCVYLPLDLYKDVIGEDTDVSSVVKNIYNEMIRGIGVCKVKNVDVDVESIGFDVGGELVKLEKSSSRCLYTRCYGQTIVIESVGVSGLTHGSRTRLVYTYEAIPPKTMFHGFIVVEEDDRIVNAIEDLVGKEIFVGRGVSRGFGRVVVKNIGREYMGNGLNIDGEVEGFIRGHVNEQALFISLSLYSNGYLDRLYGGVSSNRIVSTGLELYGGWSKFYHLLKPMIYMHRHGTIVYRKYGFIEEYYNDLLRYPGLDFLIPFNVYKRIVRW